jgi:putative flippase GtrA
MVERVGAQFSSFALVGFVGTVAHYALLVLLVEVFAVAPVSASVAGALTGATVNYFLNHRYTFNSNSSHRAAAPRYFVLTGFAFILNGTLMWLAIDNMGLSYLVGQMATTLVVLCWTYLGSKLWVFRRRSNEQ